MYKCGVKIKFLTKIAKLLQVEHQYEQIYVNVKNKCECELQQQLIGTICIKICETTNSNYWKEYSWKILNRYFKTRSQI